MAGGTQPPGARATRGPRQRRRIPEEAAAPAGGRGHRVPEPAVGAGSRAWRHSLTASRRKSWASDRCSRLLHGPPPACPLKLFARDCPRRLGKKTERQGVIVQQCSPLQLCSPLHLPVPRTTLRPCLHLPLHKLLSLSPLQWRSQSPKTPLNPTFAKPDQYKVPNGTPRPNMSHLPFLFGGCTWSS